LLLPKQHTHTRSFGWIAIKIYNEIKGLKVPTYDAGLASMPRQSGSSVWHRPAIEHSGNGRVRTAFYMATLTAARFNPAIKAFYNRLLEAGKPEKVARCAAARKLLHRAWAVVKKDQLFDPNYAQG
jgi:transposase